MERSTAWFATRMVFLRRPRKPLACLRTRLRRRCEGTARGALDMDQSPYGIQRLMRWVSVSLSTRVPRRFRICSLERLIMPWRLRVCPDLILPDAVKRKRFLALDFVFSLGILRLLIWPDGPAGRFISRHGMPFRRAARISAGRYSRDGRICKRAPGA